MTTCPPPNIVRCIKTNGITGYVCGDTNFPDDYTEIHYSNNTTRSFSYNNNGDITNQYLEGSGLNSFITQQTASYTYDGDDVL
mgnify:CR=1 FL=1